MSIKVNKMNDFKVCTIFSDVPRDTQEIIDKKFKSSESSILEIRLLFICSVVFIILLFKLKFKN